MLKYFDSHTHTNDEHIIDQYDQVMQECINQHVYMNIVGCDQNEFQSAIDQANQNPYGYATIGIHPTYTYDKDLGIILDEIRSLVQAHKDKIVAIGEIGLDYHYPDTNKAVQRVWFEAQIELALELGLPIQMHIRDAMDDAFMILKQYEGRGLTAIFHCFAGNEEDVKRAEDMDINFYYSFAGNLTYKSATKLQAAVQVVPLNKLLCETDAPYLTPVPFRGKTNYPYHVIQVYEWISNSFHLDLAKLCDQVLKNTQTVFNLKTLLNFF